MKRLNELCDGWTKPLSIKDTKKSGIYKVFGASGLVGYRDDYQVSKDYIGVIKDGAGVGRVNIYPGKSSLLGTLQYLIPNDEVDIYFLKYAIENLKLGKSFKGATIPHIYFKNYGSYLIPSFTFQQMKYIGKNLNRIDELISKKTSQIIELNSLVKSRFMWQEGIL